MEHKRREFIDKAEGPTLAKRDPFAGVCELGGESKELGLVLGCFAACLVHGISLMLTLGMSPEDIEPRQTVQILYVDLVDEPAPPIPPDPPKAAAEPEPIPKPEPVAPKWQKPPEKEEPPEEVETQPAEAAKILTAPPLPNEEPARGAEAFASGNGTLGYGMVAGDGRGNGANFDPRARVTNTLKSKSEEPKQAQDSAADRARPARLIDGLADPCAFPDGADADFALVQVSVTVGLNGKALSADVISAPSAAFAEAARRCAMRQVYQPGRDKEGRPTITKTPPVRVRFTR